MRHLFLFLAVMIGISCASAAPYDLTATFDAPTTGGQVVGYRIYRGCEDLPNRQLVGEVESGQTLTGAVAQDGSHYFCVAAFNSTGEGAIEEIVQVNIDDFEPVPGAVSNLQISVSCDASCNVTVTARPIQ